MSKYDDLSNELSTARALNALEKQSHGFVDKIPDSVDTVKMTEIVGLAKMGFGKLADGAAFGKDVARYPHVKQLMDRVGSMGVVTQDGKVALSGKQPVVTNYDGFMGAFGNKYRANPRILAELEADLKENPKLGNRMVQALKENPQAATRAINSYTGAEQGGGKIETLVDGIIGPEEKKKDTKAPADPVTKRPAVVAAAPAEKAPAQKSPVEKPELAGGPKEAPAADRVEPMTAAAGKYETADEPAAGKMALTTASLVGTDNKGGIVSQLTKKLREEFPDMETRISSFETTIRGKAKLQQDIVDNLNNNPEFVAQMMKFANDKKDPKKKDEKSALQQFGHDEIGKLLDDPSQLASNTYVDSLTSKLKMADNPLSGLIDMAKNSGIGQAIMGFLRPFIEGIQNLFSGLGSGGNFLSTGNTGGGISGMFSNFTAGLSQAKDFGAFSRASLQYQLPEAGVVDRKPSDGKISDGYEYTADGKRVQVESGKKDSEGKPILQDKYDESKDDRIEVTDARGKKHKVYDTTGINDGEWNGKPLKFYVTEVDRETGQPKNGINLFVKNGQVEAQNPDTGEAVKPTTPSPDEAVRRLGVQNNLNTATPSSPGSGPAGGASVAAYTGQ